MNNRKLARPGTPQEFLDRVHALVSAGRDREALAFAEQHSREFLPHLTAEELNRLSGTMEGAQMIVDLEDWEASQSETNGPVAPEAVSGQALPATGC